VSAFEFYETMSGSFRLATSPGEDRAMSFTIRVRGAPLLRFVRRPIADIEGEIDAEGFADHRYLRGTLGLDVVRTKTLPYAFTFTANDGRSYAFEGQKTLANQSLTQAMTILPGSILDASRREIAHALLRFDLRNDLVRFLRSFRRTT
jgi:hypothetical protein